MMMAKLNVLLIFWCAVMMMMMMQVKGLLIKRSNVPVPAVAPTLGSLLGQAAEMGTQAGNGTTVGSATAMATTANTASPPAAVKSYTRHEAAQDNERAGVLGATTVSSTTDTVIVEEPPRLAPSVGLAASLLSELQRARRHLSLMNAAPLMARSDQQQRPPFEYNNFSPNVNHDIKEFELAGPNMMPENVQQDLDNEPEMVQQDIHLLSAPANELSEHYPKYQLPVALPLRFNMLYPDTMMETAIKMHYSRISPLIQFLNGALDQALQNNHVAIDRHDRLQDDRVELETDAQMDKDKNDNDNNKNDKKNKRQDSYKKDELKKLLKIKEAAEVAPNRKEDEIVISCPIHHEHHANSNGQIVDTDIVSVDQCQVL